MALRLRVALALALVPLAYAACSGDDITYGPADGGAQDASFHPPDATSGEAAVDAGVDSGGCALFDAAGLDPNQIDAGRVEVLARKCQQCHGGNLSGNNNGVQAPGGRTAYPPNLTSDPGTGLGCWSNDQIQNAILHGFDDQDAALCPPMPVFAEAGLDTTTAQAIVAYLRSLHVMVNQVPATDCPPLPDAGFDAPPPVDAGIDAPPLDAGSDAPADAGQDASAPIDAETDATPDAGVDADMPDAADAGD